MKNFIESPKAQYNPSLQEKQAAKLVKRYESMLNKLQRLNSKNQIVVEPIVKEKKTDKEVKFMTVA